MLFQSRRPSMATLHYTVAPGIKRLAAMPIAAMTCAEFGDTVFLHYLRTASSHVQIVRCLCFAGFADRTGRRATAVAQRMPGEGQCAAARHAREPSARRREDRRGRDHLCGPL